MDSIITIPASSVRVVPLRNPRAYFDVSDLVPSLKASGGNDVPIIVQPADEDGCYPLIDGERRYRASLEAGTPVRAVVRDVDDAEAVRVAFMASIGRRDLGPGEEAKMAQRMLIATNSDHDDAAKRLGWSRSKLDARMLLLNITPTVLEALNNRTIKLGHAELLSSFPPETQDGTVKAILEQGVSVADLKARVAGFAHALSAAPFDLAGCQGCAHNTTQQADLFTVSVGDGRCTNNACWTGKVDAFLEATKTHLAEDVPVVWFDRERTPDSYAPLAARGADGVGEQQALTCKGCKHFGTLLLTIPGKAGQTLDSQCFDLACNADKRKTYQTQMAPAPSATPSSSTAPQPGSTQGPVPKSATARKPQQANGLPRSLQEHIDGRWRTIAAATATDVVSKAISTYLALKGLESGMRVDVGKAVSPVLGAALGVGGNEATALTELAKLHDEARVDLHDRITQAHLAAQTTAINAVKAALRIAGTNLAEHFHVDQDFLDKHTKSGLEALLRDAGFAQWLDGATGSKKGKGFAALMSKKKGDIIRAVLLAQEGGNFDFTGYVPPSVAITAHQEIPSHA